jgi:phospholipid/cholesterol/gamma-HCH transport system ATP-binding protein
MIGLLEPSAGDVLYGGESFTQRGRRGAREVPAPLRRPVPEGRAVELDDAGGEHRARARGVHRPPPAEIREVAAFKLALVGLAGFEDHTPNEVSGGMQKRAGIARAIALDPEILFLDEPSAGLDPVTSRRLDDLIVTLRDSLGDHDPRRDARAREPARDRRRQHLPRRRDEVDPRAGRPRELLESSTDPRCRRS